MSNRYIKKAEKTALGSPSSMYSDARHDKTTNPQKANSTGVESLLQKLQRRKKINIFSTNVVTVRRRGSALSAACNQKSLSCF